MTKLHFRTDLDSYEAILARWVKFSITTSPRLVTPNGLMLEDNGRLWLLHEVKDTDLAIKCRDGTAVRLLKLGLINSAERTVH